MSDLHATGGGGGKQDEGVGSWFSASPNPGVRGEDPYAGLQALIARDQIKADLLLCAGDMANRADPAGLRHAWRCLNELAEQLGARLVATAGNHDVDSRYVSTTHDPRGALFELQPIFPIPTDPRSRDKYWARNFSVLNTESYRVVTLNSCAFHGYSDQVAEYEHGRISKATASRLADEIASTPRAAINILLVHHHPERLPDVDLDDYSEMKLGQVLLQTLSDDGPWLVVHGHRHVPRLRNASGAGESPILFSAGSFAAHIHPEAASGHSRNQVYLLDFPSATIMEQLGLDLAGKFRAWDWNFGTGWAPARAGSGLPAAGGFGWRTHINALAKRLGTAVISEAGRLPWASAITHEPRLEYLLPEDLRTLKKRLAESSNRIDLAFSEDGTVIHLAGVGP